MQPSQIELIKLTVPVLQKHGETITTVFYRELLAAHPELNAMFHPANQADGSQAKRLAGAILAYAANIDKLVALDTPIDNIAHKHVSLHVLPEQYPIVGHHLLGAIQIVLGDAATPEILDAWSAAYNQLADIMIAREKAIYASTAN